MRLSKRQLKRIIREEYSRLKRRGLIRESQFTQDGALKANARGIVQVELKEFAGMSAEEVRQNNSFPGEMEAICLEALEDALAQCGGRVALPDMDGFETIFIQVKASDFEMANTSQIVDFGMNRPGCKWKLKNGELQRLQTESILRESMNPELMMDLEDFEDQLEMSCGERYQRGELSLIHI